MSFSVGSNERSKERPYYAIVRESRTRDTGAPTGRWFWTVRKYSDNSTAFRGPGDGFRSQQSAVDDLIATCRAVKALDLDIRDQ